jgi:hypothetical protein
MGMIGHNEAKELSIPSFASERCRAMTTNLIRTLETIAPTDDQAREDRALACFVVACGELAEMRNTGHRDTVVEQLTVVARKLVQGNAATPQPARDKAISDPQRVRDAAVSQPQLPQESAVSQPLRDQAQGLAHGLMRGLLRGAPPAAPKRATATARRPIFDLTVDPPEVPVREQPSQHATAAPDEIATRETAQTETVLAEPVAAETVPATAVAAEAVQPISPATDAVRSPTAQDDAIQVAAIQDEPARRPTLELVSSDGRLRENAQTKDTAMQDTLFEDATLATERDDDAASNETEADAALSWDEFETMLKQRATELRSSH